ncbi:MAG: NAD(P)H-quinone oxidoreductase [Candidatus Eremiobacteraeota bacterium]|nr:NAD(P)H-quinone oxidoreductase [Candidatus Eremiobacteraeota bacterium]
MKCVSAEHPGGPDVLRVVETALPEPSPDEVLIAVEAAGVSRADVMQRQGRYPPPPGASPILGLEVAGTIAATGSRVRRWSVGERVCALTNGGGYAEYVAVPDGQVLAAPEGWSAIESATLPENAFTVYDNLIERARLQRGETVLIHGGTSGIGSTAIMFARAVGARAVATAGSDDKCAACRRMGAVHAINYRAADFVAETKAATGGSGADVILDIVGGDYIARDLEALALDGRIVCLATPSGSVIELDLRRLFVKRGALLGSSLRPRSDAEKAAIARKLARDVWPLLPRRDPIVPLVDSVFTFERAAEAHTRLESSRHVGKIVLVPSEANTDLVNGK